MASAQSYRRLEEFCHRFSVMTGYPMHFSPVETEVFNSPNTVWQHEVSSGNQQLGVLRIDQPSGRGFDDALMDACRTADSLVRSQSLYMFRHGPAKNETPEISSKSVESLDVDRLKNDLEFAAKCHSSDGVGVVSKCGTLTADWVVCNRHQVGGDFCVFRPLSERQTLIAIGDAAGNGVTAAMLAANLRGGLEVEFRQEIHSDKQFQEKVCRLNQLIWECSEPHQFISCVIAVFDHSLQQMFYINAGHPPPLRLNSDEIVQLESHGMMLGTMPDTTYSSSSIEFESSGRVLFFSDGIPECKNSAGEMFRVSGLIDFCQGKSVETRKKFLIELQEQLGLFSDQMPIEDDYSAMVVDVSL